MWLQQVTLALAGRENSVPEQLLGEPLLNACLFSASPFWERAQLCCHSRGYLLDNGQQITFIRATKGKTSNDARIFQVYRQHLQRKRKRVRIQFCSSHPVIPQHPRASSLLQSDCWGPPQINTKRGDSKRWSDSSSSSKSCWKELFIPLGDSPDMLMAAMAVSAPAASNRYSFVCHAGTTKIKVLFKRVAVTSFRHTRFHER